MDWGMVMLLGAAVGVYALIMLRRVEFRRGRIGLRAIAIVAVAPLTLFTGLLLFWWLTGASRD